MSGHFHHFAHVVHHDAGTLGVGIGSWVGVGEYILCFGVYLVLRFGFLHFVDGVLGGDGESIFYFFTLLLLRQAGVGHGEADECFDVLVAVLAGHALQLVELLALFVRHPAEDALHAPAVVVTFGGHASCTNHAK